MKKIFVILTGIIGMVIGFIPKPHEISENKLKSKARK
jgi:hypothetical protein